MTVNIPTTLLRSFVAIVDTGSMLSAADQVFVTQSALSLQIKRLEELVQQNLFNRDGRRLALTPAGDVLLDYARRVLALHDEALAAVNAAEFTGPVRVGMVQDFAGTLLTGLLARFANIHPESQIYARVGRTTDLASMIERSQLDIIFGFGGADDPTALRVEPMEWLGNQALLDNAVLPLVVLDRPCRFREAAVTSLENSGRSYRIAVETPNLSTLRAAVQAGMGITCRSALFLDGIPRLTEGGLPPLPRVACIVNHRDQLDQATSRLAQLASELIREL